MDPPPAALRVLEHSRRMFEAGNGSKVNKDDAPTPFRPARSSLSGEPAWALSGWWHPQQFDHICKHRRLAKRTVFRNGKCTTRDRLTAAETTVEPWPGEMRDKTHVRCGGRIGSCHLWMVSDVNGTLAKRAWRLHDKPRSRFRCHERTMIFLRIHFCVFCLLLCAFPLSVLSPKP